MEDYKMNLDLAFKTSVFSHFGNKLADMNSSRLDPAQRRVLEAVLAPNVDAVACLGGPGCGKTYLIAQILLQWDALVRTYPPANFEENYVERFTLRTGQGKSAIEWLPSVKRLRPLVVVLHQTNEALANCARAVKAVMANFVLIKSQRVDGFTDHSFYQDFEAQARSIGEFVTASKTARTLGGISVVLCTKGAYFAVSHNLCKVGQPAMFLADESRQLSATSLCTALQQATLVSKVAVFGDVEQLPQYRSNLMPDQLSALESVHRLALANPWLYAELKVQTHFLNQSRRLPVALTHFLSKEVYHGQLRDGTHAPPQETTMGSHDGYLRFVYCDDSSEELAGTSRKNLVEARAAVKIACLFRSLNVNLSIVTPYLAQRALIEELLAKQRGWSASSDSHGLAADASVFTIDSYQGRENNAIIFSPVVTGVRADGAEPFVMERHRQTVALSRCKEFLVVVTNQRFLQQAHTRKPTILTKLHSQTVGWQYNDDVRPLRDWIHQQKDARGYDS